MRMILAVGITIIDPRNANAWLRQIAYKVAAGWLVIGLTCVGIGALLMTWADRTAAVAPPPPVEIVDISDFTPDRLVAPLDEVRLTGMVQLGSFALVEFRDQDRGLGKPDLMIPVTTDDWQRGDPVRVFLLAGRNSAGIRSDVFVDFGVLQGTDGKFRMSALVREDKPFSYFGPVRPKLVAAGLNVPDDVILVSALDDASRQTYFRHEFEPVQRVARFIVYMGLVIAGFGLFGRRRGMLPPTR